MVWPFSSPSNNDPSSSQTLDPSLAEFAKSQKPGSYKVSSSSASSKSQTGPQPSEPSQSPPPAPSPVPDDPSARPSYASRSAFSDGRYDHLWTTYKSKSEIDTETKSDQEKASDLLDTHKLRASKIKSAAMENCSAELFAQWNCTNGGSWARRATLCRPEQRDVTRCVMMQGRFLRALGYKSELGRPPEVEEDVQLHADDLYRRMLGMEKEAEMQREKAKAEGRESGLEVDQGLAEAQRAAALTAPDLTKKREVERRPMAGQTFRRNDVDTLEDPALPVEAEGMSAATVSGMKERLRQLGPVERALERAAIVHEIEQATYTLKEYDGLQLKAQKEREARRAAGSASIGDYISGIFGR